MSKLKIGYISLLLVSLILMSGLSLAVAAPPSQGTDVAVISEPSSGATVQGTIQIIGSADHPTFEYYEISVSPAGVERWQYIGDGRNSVVNGPLLTWNTAMVPDGDYTLRLRVVRFDGNYSEAYMQQIMVMNTAPLPTEPPTATPTISQTIQSEEPEIIPEIPTFTPIPPTPTPTIIVDQPIVETPTPRPTETPIPTPSGLTNPDEDTNTLIPTVKGISAAPLRNAFFYGAGLMLTIFMFFGFLSALRLFFQGFIDRQRERF